MILTPKHNQHRKTECLMASSKDKPKPAAKIKRNDSRRNGKAFGKNSGPTITAPGTPCKGEKGGRFGYSYKRLKKMAAEQGVTIMTIEDEIREKLEAKADRARRTPRQSAARPGIGDCTYKMTSVNRHFDKTRPYPCVKKGLTHAGATDKKADTEQRKAAREARRNGKPDSMTKANEMALAGLAKAALAA